MPLDPVLGVTPAGALGRGTHLGAPLTVAEIAALQPGDEIVITWDGGNGPHPHLVVIDNWGAVCVDTPRWSPILASPAQRVPLHRVTCGWDEQSRAWHAEYVRPRTQEA